MVNRQDGTFDDQQQQQQQQQVLVSSGAANLLSRHNNRILAVPRSLARFLFYNARQPGVAVGQQNQLVGGAGSGSSGGNGGESIDNGGYERSSRALDAISGMTIGKRSANPLDYVNVEPVYGRQSYAQRAPVAHSYDLRWPPLETFEIASGFRD